MALPELPAQGQTPWYTPRTNWDLAVEAELEGRLSETALDSSFVRGSMILPGVNGIVGDGVADDTAAIQAVINATPRSSTVYLSRPSVGDSYLITATLSVTTDDLRFVGPGRDIYAANIKKSTAGAIFEVKAERFSIAESLGLVGNGGTYGAGATADGIVLLGDVDGNIDARISGGSFLYLSTAVRIRGRNVKIEDALFSQCSRGVVIDGPLAGYHDETSWISGGNRGNIISGSRFHGVGETTTDAGIMATPEARISHAEIINPTFDGPAPGKGIMIEGTSTTQHRHITITRAKHFDVMGDAITLAHTQFSTLNNTYLTAVNRPTSTGRGIYLYYCSDVTVADAMLSQMKGDALVLENTGRVTVDGFVVREVEGDGIVCVTPADRVDFRGVTIYDATGWGFIGEATNSILEATFQDCALGDVSSTTLGNSGGTQTQFISSTDGWHVSTGAPSITDVNGSPALMFDQTAVEQITRFISIPVGWARFHVDLVWAGAVAGTGNVRWGRGIVAVPPAAGIPSSSATEQTASANGGVIRETRLVTNQQRTTETYGLRILRNGGHADDTYAGDAGIIGIRIIRA